jgi:hypothetical protein
VRSLLCFDPATVSLQLGKLFGVGRHGSWWRICVQHTVKELFKPCHHTWVHLARAFGGQVGSVGIGTLCRKQQSITDAAHKGWTEGLLGRGLWVLPLPVWHRLSSCATADRYYWSAPNSCMYVLQKMLWVSSQFLPESSHKFASISEVFFV